MMQPFRGKARRLFFKSAGSSDPNADIIKLLTFLVAKRRTVSESPQLTWRRLSAARYNHPEGGSLLLSRSFRQALRIEKALKVQKLEISSGISFLLSPGIGYTCDILNAMPHQLLYCFCYC